MTMPTRNRALAVVIVLVVTMDWVLKAIVQRRLEPSVPHTVVEGWLTLKRTLNEGISWGLLNGVEAWWRLPLVVALSLVALAATVAIVRASTDRWLRLGGALVLGGALGNLGDRLVHGGVTDFVHVHPFPFVFNLADVAICLGGALLVARMIVEDRRRAEPASA